MASANNKLHPNLPKLTSEEVSTAVTTLTDLPLKRDINQLLNNERLVIVGKLLRRFLSSTNSRAVPSKDVLHKAVSALLEPSAKKLSPAWKKDQLAQVMLEWIRQALLLTDMDDQTKLFVRVHGPAGSKRSLSHETVFLKGELEDGSVAGFSIASPQTPRGSSALSDSSPASSASAMTKAKPGFTPGNLSEEAKQFLHDLDEVANASAELALEDKLRTQRVLVDFSPDSSLEPPAALPRQRSDNRGRSNYGRHQRGDFVDLTAQPRRYVPPARQNRGPSPRDNRRPAYQQQRQPRY